MASMKVYVLYLANTKANSNYTVFDDTYASVAEPAAPHRLLDNPSTAVLIDHPEAGWILFDSGVTDDPEKELPKHIVDQVIFEKPESLKMVNQLALVGIAPKDINYVITSHMHYDHIGNDKLFVDTAEFYVPKEDAQNAFLEVMKSPDPAEQGWYIKEDVLLTRKKLTYVDRDEELFPGVEVIMLPGHTPCVMGVVIHLNGGTLIFPSDAIGDRRNYEGKLPGALYECRSYVESIRKVKDLQKRYNAKVFFSHDMALLEETKTAPQFYE